MFRQIKNAKKARSLMEDYRTPPDHHDWVQIILVLIFLIAFIGIWYYTKKANNEIKSGKINTHNPIINNINSTKTLNETLKKYNSIGTIDDTQLDY